MKYIIYSDIDGTFYSHKQEINQDTLKDIAHAQSKGILFVLATGNAYLTQVRHVTEVSKADYFIGSNGAIVYDIKNDKVLFENRIPNDIAQKIADVAIKYNLGVDFWNEDEVFVLDNNAYPKHVIEILKNVILKDKYPTMTNNVQVRPFKMEYVITEKSEVLDKAIEEISNLGLTIARITPHHCEITLEGSSKGNAIKFLNNYLKLDKKHTMAIGDSGNDISMFSEAEYTYLMADHKPNMEGTTKYHTSSPEQNGLGEAIQDFMYRNKID